MSETNEWPMCFYCKAEHEPELTCQVVVSMVLDGGDYITTFQGFEYHAKNSDLT